MNYDELKSIRIEKSMSLQEMAEALGLKTAGGYKRIETGENKLKAEQLPFLAKKFEMSLENLMARLFLETGVEQSSTFGSKPT